MERHLLQCLFLLLMLSAVTSASSATQVAYRATIFGVLPGYTQSWACDINDSGMVVGDLTGSGNYGGSFIWNPVGGMRDAGVPDDYPSGGITRVNNSGQILGTTIPHYVDYARAFILKDGVVTELPSLYGACTWGADMNDHGHVVGRSLDGDADIGSNPYIYDNNGIRRLPTPGMWNEGEALAINNNGRVGGVVDNHAFIWLENGIHRDLGTLPGYQFGSQITALNDFGRAVGYSDNNGPSRAFYVDGIGSLMPLTAMSKALDINNNSQIVGTTTSFTACLWDPLNGYYELPVPVADSRGSVAMSINESGWIAGYYYDSSWRSVAVLWTPVPEPSCMVALLSGCAVFAGVVRRRK